MAFKHVYESQKREQQTYERNQRPENRCCTNCSYYTHEDGEYICTCDRYKDVIYRMPEPSIARGKVCGNYYPSKYRIYD